MTDSHSSAEDIFFNQSDLDDKRIESLVQDSLHDTDDGELFMEYCQSESFSFDDGRLKAANYDTSRGFGLRAVVDEATGFAHSTELSEDAIKRAAASVQAVRGNHTGEMASAPIGTNEQYYDPANPLGDQAFA